jgi:Domain of unknown function (DUF4625)
MKTIKLTFISVIGMLIIAAVSSCEKIAKPVLILEEVGLDDNKIGIIGSDLHVEADITAEGTISAVTVEIHPEGTGTWEFDSTYTEFSGLKNTTFHKHIVIPVTAEAGDYHLHISVTDMEGNVATAESELELQEPSDAVTPVLTVTSAPSTGETFTTGQTITISGTVTDDIALGGIYIGLVRSGLTLDDSQISSANSITMLHTHSFNTPTSYQFSATIIVGAAMDNDITPKDITGEVAWQSGNYYILVKSKDAFGGNWAYSNHYQIAVSL